MLKSIHKLIGIVCVLVMTNGLFAQEKVFKYVGVGGCKACHMTNKMGAQYKVWQSMKHSQAYATLASEKALAVGKERGIAEPQKSEACLSCHVTAYGTNASLLGPKYKLEDGVGCESCHGPGSEYKSKKFQEGIAAGTIEMATVGMIKPTEAVCVKCHNEKSPTFKGFDFQERSAKIAHPKPEGPSE